MKIGAGVRRHAAERITIVVFDAMNLMRIIFIVAQEFICNRVKLKTVIFIGEVIGLWFFIFSPRE